MDHPISRRHALGLGGAGALGLVLAGTALPATSALADPAPIAFTVTNDSEQDGLHVSFIGTVGEGSTTQGYVKADGSHEGWPTASSAEPVAAPDTTAFVLDRGQSATMQLPYWFSGRIWYIPGKALPLKIVRDDQGRMGTVQPVPWVAGSGDEDLDVDFVEATYSQGGLYLNTTQVDYVGRPARVSATGAEGRLTTGGMPPGGLATLAEELEKVPPFGSSVQRSDQGELLRVLSPTHTIPIDAEMGTVLDDYISRVWDKYSSEDLIIRPDLNRPEISFTCRVRGGQLCCVRSSNGAETRIDKPTTANAFAADGALQANDEPSRGEENRYDRGMIARSLAADLNRGVLGSAAQSPCTDVASFYRTTDLNGGAMNHYSRVLHDLMPGGKAYGFSFDDVVNQESLVHVTSPTAASATILAR